MRAFPDTIGLKITLRSSAPNRPHKAANVRWKVGGYAANKPVEEREAATANPTNNSPSDKIAAHAHTSMGPVFPLGQRAADQEVPAK
jgi:hypothetical protein